jgi:hypothetical protein
METTDSSTSAEVSREDVSPEAEECPLLEEVTKQSSEDRD